MRNIPALRCVSLLALMTSLSGLWTSGCIENEIHDPGKVFPEYDPIPLEERGPQEDRIVQLEVPTVDILFVIDDSCSMENDQTKLAGFAPVVSSALSDYGVNFHVGSTTTDWLYNPEAGNVLWFQNSPDVNMDVALQDLIQRGSLGSGSEMGSAALWSAFEKRDAENKEFFRYETPLHIITISDESDQSVASTQQAIFPFLAERRSRSAGVLTYSAIIEPYKLGDENQIACGAAYAEQYLELAKAFPGVIVDICAEDWSRAIDQIVAQFAPQRTKYYLSRPPQEDSIVVTVERGPAVIDVNDAGWVWTYDASANFISFSPPSPVEADDIVVITYEVRE